MSTPRIDSDQFATDYHCFVHSAIQGPHGKAFEAELDGRVAQALLGDYLHRKAVQQSQESFRVKREMSKQKQSVSRLLFI